MAYLVSQRTAEIGIRMALGATARQVLIGILAQGLKATALGIGVGVAGAAALSWALHTTLVFPGSADLFYGVPFYDPLTFSSLVGFLAFLAGAASLVPARRAIQVDPTVALRHG
jgi:ABC-type lipoprotein release transport system permease subunit